MPPAGIFGLGKRISVRLLDFTALKGCIGATVLSFEDC